jgi:hypothetical protein
MKYVYCHKLVDFLGNIWLYIVQLYSVQRTCTTYTIHVLMYTYRKAQPEIPHTLDPSLLSLLVVPLVRELRSTRSCDFLNRGGGFIKGILRGVRSTKSLRVFFTVLFRKQDYEFSFAIPPLVGAQFQ